MDRRNDSISEQNETHSGNTIFSQLLEKVLQGTGVLTADDEASFSILFDSSPDPVILLSVEGEIQEANPAFTSAYGYSSGVLRMKTIFDLLPDSAQPLFREKVSHVGTYGIREGINFSDNILTFDGLRSDGTSLAMDCLLSAYEGGHGTVVVMIVRHLPIDRELYNYLQETRDHYLALSETVTEAIFRIDENFMILFANSGVKTTFGLEKSEVVGKHLSTLFPEEVFKQHEKVFHKYFIVDDADRESMGMKGTLEILGNRKHRGVSPMEMSFGNSKDFKGRTLTCIIRDITQRKLIERKFRHLAFHDRLTGLGNRELFNEDLQNLFIELEKDESLRGSIFFLDLDGFKHINDTLGHDAGDFILVESARRLRVCLRDTDYAYRFGGDEFVLLLTSIKQITDSTTIANRILDAIQRPYQIETGENRRVNVHVGVSIGIAVVPDHGNLVSDATKSADIAMYCSKEAGKNRYTVFNETLNSKATEDWQLEQDMKTALVGGQFVLYYQPIVNTEGFIQGAEALIRWDRPDGTQVSPGKFIPLAEKNDVINTMGNWVLRRAFAESKLLHKLGFPDLFVSVNLSAKQFNQIDFTENLIKIIEKSGIDPALVKLELTETAIMNHPAEAVEKLRVLKARFPKIRFMVDDFGTGYSSLSYLSRFPVDSLKIDISFVKDLFEKQNEKVVNAIIHLAHSLDMSIVAEGIESPEQRDYFREREVEHLQGFYFMKGVPIKVLFEALHRQKNKSMPLR